MQMILIANPAHVIEAGTAACFYASVEFDSPQVSTPLTLTPCANRLFSDLRFALPET
jgi:hypothetical protein